MPASSKGDRFEMNDAAFESRCYSRSVPDLVPVTTRGIAEVSCSEAHPPAWIHDFYVEASVTVLIDVGILDKRIRVLGLSCVFRGSAPPHRLDCR